MRYHVVLKEQSVNRSCLKFLQINKNIFDDFQCRLLCSEILLLRNEPCGSSIYVIIIAIWLYICLNI